jgi:hypothetical protein
MDLQILGWVAALGGPEALSPTPTSSNPPTAKTGPAPAARYDESAVFSPPAGSPHCRSVALASAGDHGTAMPNTTPTSQNRKPTLKQINYLKVLATRTGTTFTYPKTASQASAEINRLQQMKSRGSSFAELATARNAAAAAWDTPATEGRACDIQDFEIDGYGSSARWA